MTDRSPVRDDDATGHFASKTGLRDQRHHTGRVERADSE